MNKKNNTLLQKLKDNAFNLALGIGMFAILAMVAVYTINRNGKQFASNDLDLNMASDYSEITTEAKNVKTTTGKTADRTGEASRTNVPKVSTTERVVEQMPKEEKRMIAPESITASTTESVVAKAEESTVPVTTDVGALDFSSEATLSWPVKGEVILPFSMETTVYFKTLDQYQCNSGMLIAAGNGSTVQNAYLGQVTKVTSDNMYGNMVTVYLGNDYSVVYGQLDTIYVKEGDFVKAGQSIGTIGKPTDSFTEEGSHLFFEMFEGDKPIDPLLFME